MLDKILTDSFRTCLKKTFADIEAQQDRRDLQEFKEDEPRIRDKLLAEVQPYPQDVVLDEDFLVAAVDGSGSDSLSVLDDVRVHLVSSATVILDSNTHGESLFRPLDANHIESLVGHSQPFLDTHWHSGVRNDARKKLAETLMEIYPLKELNRLVLPFFTDFTRGKITSMADLEGSEYAGSISALLSMESLISRAQILTESVVHEQFRTVAEYAAARAVLTSSVHPKYLLLDGALSIFMHPTRQYPSMPSGFMLRELCALARKEGVILCAVSKNHTIPFAHRIGRLAQQKYGNGAKWFCHLPGREDPGGELRIYSNRPYIPPTLAVPYLYSFSRDNRPSRIDFDRIWWLQNIYVKDDPVATRENEQALFRDIEFMSRDARWYGYPVALALAHEQCKLSYEDLRIAREVCRDVRMEMGIDEQRGDPLREDFNL
ncbi:MAG: hypothetical protein HXY34_03060 [Candidatus Thorarchaeota archaeon]|nr:hypothetical protein [Candidatus Thorarchaeota archaeon]